MGGLLRTNWRIEECSLERVLPLRARITYDGRRSPEACVSPEELAAAAKYYVVVADDLDVATAALVRRSTKLLGKRPRWHLSFLAVDPDWRNQGIATALVETRLDEVRRLGAKYAWCEARVSAAPLYEKLGAVSEGEVYELDPIGPHVRMLYGPLL